VGFHERKSRYVADIKECHVLPPHVSAMLLPLRELIFSMDARDTCPQIELACGDRITALVLRHLEPLSQADQQRLRSFASVHTGVQWWLQAKGPETIVLLDPPSPDNSVIPLAYSLPEFGVSMPFKPTDFTQVNPYINEVLVSRAVRLLGLKKSERVIDWFCGLGNFTMPIATQAGAVLGVEGSATLVARALQNFEKNKQSALSGIEYSAIDFVERDLFHITSEQLLQDGTAEKWLIDPPREGAFALVKALVDLVGHIKATPQPTHWDGQLNGWSPPRRIVYVSCNPATLARDAGLLVNLGSYRCSQAGAVNMFPHTAHVESLAVFDWMG
jgi:23S rRNA (uracil1939-C5)-methyltransferase